jgi:hypothetical protein
VLTDNTVVKNCPNCIKKKACVKIESNFVAKTISQELREVFLKQTNLQQNVPF